MLGKFRAWFDEWRLGRITAASIAALASPEGAAQEIEEPITCKSARPWRLGTCDIGDRIVQVPLECEEMRYFPTRTHEQNGNRVTILEHVECVRDDRYVDGQGWVDIIERQGVPPLFEPRKVQTAYPPGTLKRTTEPVTLDDYLRLLTKPSPMSKLCDPFLMTVEQLVLPPDPLKYIRTDDKTFIMYDDTHNWVINFDWENVPGRVYALGWIPNDVVAAVHRTYEGSLDNERKTQQHLERQVHAYPYTEKELRRDDVEQLANAQGMLVDFSRTCDQRPVICEQEVVHQGSMYPVKRPASEVDVFINGFGARNTYELLYLGPIGNGKRTNMGVFGIYTNDVYSFENNELQTHEVLVAKMALRLPFNCYALVAQDVGDPNTPLTIIDPTFTPFPNKAARLISHTFVIEPASPPAGFRYVKHNP
ncbi:MAG: hypothetical protein OXR66_05270 [Candidatus Woesearchaeota archaeon]|nr:hypothetical protein [Candidatus Woesearchaeota archaeon]